MKEPTCDRCGLPLASAAAACSRCFLEGALGSAGEDYLGPGFVDELPLPEVARRIAGKYIILDTIARGGMGVVYQAMQEPLARRVALKMLLGGAHASDEFKRRFLQEAQAAARLRHDAIVGILDWGEDEGQPFFAMELIAGRDLAGLVAGQPMPARRAVEIVRAVAEAIHYAHGQGVLHRDLKPSNVLLDAEGRPHVTDFGLAKQLDQDISLTMSGDLLGTPGYMPPEQTSARSGQMGPWSDVYGLGGILYHLLTGRAPFVAGTTAEILRAVMEQEPASVRQLNSSIPAELDTICLKCLEKAPERRYQSAREVAEELGRWWRGEPILARPASTWAKARTWAGRHPTTAGLSAALAASLVIGLVATIWQWRRAEERGRLATERGRLAEERGQLATVRGRQLRTTFYAADTALAQQAYDEGKLARARGFLRGQEPAAGDEDLRGIEWRYLKYAARGDDLLALTGHFTSVHALAVSPDGAHLVSGAMEPTVRIWDTHTHSLVREVPLPGPGEHTNNGITSIAFSPDGTRLVFATARDVRLFSWPEMNLLHQFSNEYARVAFAPDGRALAIGDGSQNQVFGMGGGKVTLCDAASGVQVRQFTNVGSRVTFVPGKPWLVAGVADEAITIWDWETGALVQRLPGAGLEATALAVSPDGRVLARADSTVRIALWELPSGKALSPLQAQRFAVYQVAFTPDGRWLVSAGGDQTLRRWSTLDWTEGGIWRGHDDQVTGLAVAPDGTQIFSGGKDKTVRVWSPTPRTAETPLLTNITTMVHLAKLGWLAIGAPKGGVTCWHLQSNRVEWHLPDEIKALAASVDNRLLATSDSFKRVNVWDTTARRLLAGPLPRNRDSNGIPSAAFSRDGSRLAAGGAIGFIYIYSLGVKAPALAIRGHNEVIHDLLFAPDDRALVAAGGDGKVSVWAMPEGKLLGYMTGHEDRVWTLAFSPDGRVLATGSRDNTVRLWEWPSRRPLGSLRGHGSRVLKVAFTPDQRTVLSGSDDGTLRFWHLQTGRELAALRLEIGVTSFALSPSADALYTLDAGRAVRVWPAPFPSAQP